MNEGKRVLFKEARLRRRLLSKDMKEELDTKMCGEFQTAGRVHVKGLK